MRMQTIYERIEALIKQKKMTKKAFCEELKISTGNFGDWKRNISAPSARKLIEIAGYFNVSLDWLMTGKERRDFGNVREQEAEYFFDKKGQLNCRLEDLPERERIFITEYLAFSTYRRQQSADPKRHDTDAPQADAT